MTILNGNENVKKLSKWIENTEAKGEIVTGNFSFSHSVFKRLVLQTRKNQGFFAKGLTLLWPNELNFSLFPEAENSISLQLYRSFVKGNNNNNRMGKVKDQIAHCVQSDL